MKSISLQILLAVMLSAVACCGCQRMQGSRGAEFYSGKLTVNNKDGSASFTDCATAVTMHVTAGGAYEQVRKKFTDIKPNPDNTVFVEFRGLIRRNDPDSLRDRTIPGLVPPTVVIDTLITISRNSDCISPYIVTGIYEAQEVAKGEKHILRIRPDYTYNLSVYDADGTEHEYSGVWYRTATLVLVLSGDQPEKDRVSYQIVPPKDALSRSSGGRAMTYKKVYM